MSTTQKEVQMAFLDIETPKPASAVPPAEMQTRFTYHSPKPGQPEKYEKLRAAARHFAEAVNEICPNCRESSLATTKIEEAAFWANAAVARREVVS